MNLLILAAAATAAPEAVEEIQVVTRAPLVGNLQQGVQAYRQEFFTPVRPGTAMDMIQWLPGFTFEDVRDLRGLGGAIGNVLIDGQPPTSKNDTLSTVLRRIPAGQVDRIDIIVGGAPGIDMRGRSVLANVVLKKTGAPRGSVTVSSQVMEDGRLGPEVLVTTSRKIGDRTFEASLNAYSRVLVGTTMGEGPFIRTDGAGAIVFTGLADAQSRMPWATGTASYEFPVAGGRLKVNGSFRYHEPRLAEEAVIAGEAPLYTLDLYGRLRQAELGARYERAFGRATLESQVLQRVNDSLNESDTFRPPLISEFNQSDDQTESIARSTLRFKKSEQLSFEGSGEAAYNTLDTRSDLTLAGAPAPVPAGDVSVRERRAEIGGLVSWKPTTEHGLTAALKVETSSLTSAGELSLQRDLTYLKPRLVFSWSPDSKTQVRLRAEREVDQINFFNFVAFLEFGSGALRAGNPNLRPRRSWIGEAVVERQFWTGASVVATVRHMDITDVVDVGPLAEFGGAAAVRNIGDGSQTDLLATVTLPLKPLGLEGVMFKGSMTARRSRVTDPTTGRIRRLSGQSSVLGEAHLAHDLPRWKLNWGVDAFYYGPGNYFRPTVTESFGQVTRINVFVEYRFTADLNLRVEVASVNGGRQRHVARTFAGPRNVAPLLFADERRLASGPYLNLRLRKTLR